MDLPLGSPFEVFDFPDKTKVVVVLRPGKGKKDAPEMTTIYMPITDEEKAEIARIDNQAKDVD